MVQRLTWLVPLVLLQGCAGTPLAERLETSFGAQDAALLTAPDTVVEKQAARSVQANPTGSAINDSVSPAAELPDVETSASNPMRRSNTVDPNRLIQHRLIHPLRISPRSLIESPSVSPALTQLLLRRRSRGCYGTLM